MCLISTSVLQWGHNFFVMEILHTSGTVVDLSKLQWGHNFFVMEIWNFLLRGTLDEEELQWGHNFFVMEIEMMSKTPYNILLASMGP